MLSLYLITPKKQPADLQFPLPFISWAESFTSVRRHGIMESKTIKPGCQILALALCEWRGGYGATRVFSGSLDCFCCPRNQSGAAGRPWHVLPMRGMAVTAAMPSTYLQATALLLLYKERVWSHPLMLSPCSLPTRDSAHWMQHMGLF